MAATSFAAHADLAARWRTLSSAEQATATTLLADASQLILDEYPRAASRPAETLRRIVCAMVKRAMLANDRPSVRQQQESAGGTSLGLTFDNPMGDLYLTGSERKALKGPQRARSVPMYVETVESTEDEEI